ncbi:MAG: hypothetical protein KDA41_07670, partial [Planctomycetales bacterium]|nr:hypothetical protein [Planctomycetales bacterium]
PDGHVLLVSRLGFFRVADELPQPDDKADDKADQQAALDSPSPDASALIDSDDPRAASLRPPMPVEGEEGGGDGESGGDVDKVEDEDEEKDEDEEGENIEAEDVPMEAALEEPLDPIELLVSPETLKHYQPAGPDKPLSIDGPLAAGIDPQSGLVVLYTGGTITTFAREASGKYERQARRDLADSLQKQATLAVAGGTILLGREDGALVVIDAATLNEKQTLTPEEEVPPRFVVASSDGRWFAVLLQSRRLYLFDAHSQSLAKAGVWTQGDISAVSFAGDRLRLVDRIARVREFSLPDMRETATWSPDVVPGLDDDDSGWFGTSFNLYKAYRWLLVPTYTVLPKPGEINNAMRYLVTGETTEAVASGANDLSEARHIRRDPWRPIWTSALFVVFLLALACFRIERSEL